MPKREPKKKSPRKKNRASRKPKTKVPEPLSGPPANVGEVRDVLAWLNSVCELPVDEQNSAIRANREAVAPVLEQMVFDDAFLLHRPLAAESSGDSQSGEQTFLTLLQPMRDRLIREYRISTAAEFLVLDALVLSYYQYIRAATAFHKYTAHGQSSDCETLVRYAQPYLAKANELFLRNLQALREMKSSPITIKIEQAGQVNVGEKQLNVATDRYPHGPDGSDDKGSERSTLIETDGTEDEATE